MKNRAFPYPGGDDGELVVVGQRTRVLWAVLFGICGGECGGVAENAEADALEVSEDMGCPREKGKGGSLMQYSVAMTGERGLPLAHPHQVESWFEKMNEDGVGVDGYWVTVLGQAVWFPYEPFIQLESDPNLIPDNARGITVYHWAGHSAERYLPRITYYPRQAA